MGVRGGTVKDHSMYRSIDVSMYRAMSVRYCVLGCVVECVITLKTVYERGYRMDMGSKRRAIY